MSTGAPKNVTPTGDESGANLEGGPASVTAAVPTERMEVEPPPGPTAPLPAPVPGPGPAHVPASPLRHPQPVPQNRLSPYLPGGGGVAVRERASSLSSLGGRGGRDQSRSFGHSYSSPVPSPAGRRPRVGSSSSLGGGGAVAAGAGGSIGALMPMIPNLNPPPATPPCTPIGPPSKVIGSGGLPAPHPGVVSPSVARARARAVEAALENERARAKELEEKEKDTDAVGLRVALKRERAHSARLAADLAGLWSSAVQSQAEAEVLEEGRINSLMRRMDRLQREKGRIIVELEREEEMLTNTLQKKLNEVRREKALLEKQIEREHEENVKLKRQQQQQVQAQILAEVKEEDDDET